MCEECEFVGTFFSEHVVATARFKLTVNSDIWANPGCTVQASS